MGCYELGVEVDDDAIIDRRWDRGKWNGWQFDRNGRLIINILSSLITKILLDMVKSVLSPRCETID